MKIDLKIEPRATKEVKTHPKDLKIGQALRFEYTRNTLIRLSSLVYIKFFDGNQDNPRFLGFNELDTSDSGYILSNQTFEITIKIDEEV